MSGRAALIGLVFIATAFAQNPVVDQPPGERQLPYSPANESTVAVNPPPFVWVPVEGDATYTLELGPEPGTTGFDVIARDLKLSNFALSKPLAPGAYVWRYSATVNGQKTYSRNRLFTVPENAPTFPFPDVGEAVQRVPQAHPRLFATPDTVELLRERAATGMKTEIGNLARACEKHFGAEIVPEPPYVTGEGPERGKNYAHIFRTTRPDMDIMEQCALVYLCTGSVPHGNEAYRRILHFFSWDPEGPTSYRNNDEPAMWVMMRGVRAYDWTYDLFSEEERAKIEAVMRVRAAQFYDHLLNRRKFHIDPYESHAGRTIGFLGEVSLAFIHEWPEARTWLDYVLLCYWNAYPAWGKEDGGWNEGPGYWTAYMTFALHFVASLREATGIDLMQKPFFRNTPYYLLYTNPPYAKISPFGDGEHGGSSRGKGHLMYQFSTLTRNPYFRWYADAWQSGPGAGILGVLLYDETLKAKSPAELPPTRYFPGVGLVSVHSAFGDAANDVHFLIHSNPYGAVSHGHADQNAFTLEAYGEALAIASGYYPWYGSNHHKHWQWESRSSNTITFNGGQGQVVRDGKSKGAITAYQPGEHYDYLCADATAAYQGKLTRAIRHVVHVKPGWFVMMDDLAAPQPVEFEWNLHALSPMAMDEDFQSVTVSQGNSRLKVQLYHGDNLRFSQTDQFTAPPEQGEAPQHHFRATSALQPETRIVSVLLPYKAGGENTLPQIESVGSDSALGVRLITPEGVHTVAIRRSGASGDTSLGVYSSDGVAFAVFSAADGTPTRHLLAKGTRLVEQEPRSEPRVIAP